VDAKDIIAATGFRVIGADMPNIKRIHVISIFIVINAVLIFFVVGNFYRSYAVARDNNDFLEWQLARLTQNARTYEYTNHETGTLLIRYEDIAAEISFVSNLIQENNLRQVDFRVDEPFSIDGMIFQVRIRIEKHSALPDILPFFDALSGRPINVIGITFDIENASVETELILFAY